jgi:hypothetical protein
VKKLKLDVNVKIIKFADDTKGGRKVECEADRDKLQRALDCLCEWAKRWGMSFNTDKCIIMHVGLHNLVFEYNMRGTRICTTVEERDIGISVTRNLKPSAHCSKAAGRATAVLGQLRRNFHFRNVTGTPSSGSIYSM